ncbi:MAG: DNA polymerase I [Candidatus Gastranaerophilaceae bacterium]|nr:DNA polymerase I [Candidatus Gastranaerophilaceae bacterium]
MGNEKTLILIDGHALAFREYYALERTGMQTTSGQPTWAVYGFFLAIFDLLKNQKIKTDAIAVAFDVSHDTFRVEKYENYKSNREQMPDTMRSQMDLIYEGLRAFNIPIYTKEGFEADDVIGTISKQACELGHKVLILTGDQDAFQLIDKEGCVKVIIPSKGELKEYDWQAVYDKLGVYPDQIVDYKALRGDTSDCIPGVHGIGEKTAQVLLAEYGHLDGVISNADNIKGNSIREKIKNGIEDARLSYYLATIVRDLDVNFDFEKTKVEVPDISSVTEFLKSMQFYKFLKNINSILSAFNLDGEDIIVPEQIQTQKEISNQNIEPQTQLGLFTQAVHQEINKNNDVVYTSRLVTDSSDFDSLCNELVGNGIFSVNLKADFVNAVDNEIYGIALAYKKGFSFNDGKFTNSDKSVSAFYIPLKSDVIENKLDKDYVINGLKPILENPKIFKTTFNAKDTYCILKNQNIDMQGVIFDVELASYVANPSDRHNLDIQAIENINHSISVYAEPDEIKKLKLTYGNVSADMLLNPVCDEAATILELTAYWYNKLSLAELKILYDIEIPLSRVLADMEYDGVSVDAEYLNDLSNSINENISELERKIYGIAGCNFNLNSPKQVGEILYDKLGLKPGKKKKSTSADVLEDLAQENEIARLILQYRKYAKLKSTYTDALPALVSEKDNRIHTTYNQAVTTTGRLSSSNPNLQNIPARTEEGNKIRSAFVPENKEQSVILSADYSQIELRLLAHISKDEHLIEAFINDIDVHTLTASKVFGVDIKDVTKEMRYKSKAVNFGIIYGQSKYGLAKAVGIKNNEAEDFINKYFETYPNIKLYMESTVNFAVHHGYVETVFGRKRYLPEIKSSNTMIKEFAKRAAINQPIQGTAADIMKLAMIECSKKFKENNIKSKIIMQVHDEIVVETLKSELDDVTNIVRAAMELNQPLRVPLKIDINTGETWREQ